MEIKTIKTITGEFKQYMEECYRGQEVPPEQRMECKKAFFAGAMALLLKMETIGELPELISIPAIELIRTDLISTCEKFVEDEGKEESESSKNTSNN